MNQTVLIADDHSIYRAGLKPLLARVIDKPRLIEAGSHAETLEVIRGCPYLSLVLVDLRMPGMEGAAALEELVCEAKSVPFAVLSASNAISDIRKAFSCGVMGYITKNQPAQVIESALNLVLAGGMYLPPEFLQSAQVQSSSSDSIAGLTARQMEVLKLLSCGEPNKLIARKLSISEATVKAHIATIVRVLKVKNRTQAVIAAQKLGLEVLDTD